MLAIVLAMTAVGSTAILFAAPLWGRVRVAFFKLMGVILGVIAVLAAIAARSPLLDTAGSVPTASRAAVVLLWVFAGLTIVWQALLWARVEAGARVVGIGSIPVGLAALIAIAADPATSQGTAIAAFQLIGGALFLGAANDGLLLGHWYLVDRRLSREPLRRINDAFLVGSAIVVIASIFAFGSGAGEARQDLSPLLGAGALAVYLAIGLAVLCATIGGFIRALIKEDSIQAATGLFYLGVIMALSAEFAAKVRFF